MPLRCIACAADGRAAAGFYVRHGTFVADALASLPAFAQLVILATGESRHLLRYIYIFRLMRLYRWVGGVVLSGWLGDGWLGGWLSRRIGCVAGWLAGRAVG